LVVDKAGEHLTVESLQRGGEMGRENGSCGGELGAAPEWDMGAMSTEVRPVELRRGTEQAHQTETFGNGCYFGFL